VFPLSLLLCRGPEIRTGKLVGGKDIELEAGQQLTLTTDYTHVGTKDMIAQSYAELGSSVKEGSEVLIDDGLVALIVERVNGEHVICRVKNGGLLGETKGVNLPGAVVELPALTEKDKGDLKFGCEQKVDLVAASFIRKASDVVQIREYLTANGGAAIKIISKIENQEGLQNFDDILKVSDGIMVARGDLGVEIAIEKVAIAQKMMISKCNVAGKPVVTAVRWASRLHTVGDEWLLRKERWVIVGAEREDGVSAWRLRVCLRASVVRRTNASVCSVGLRWTPDWLPHPCVVALPYGSATCLCHLHWNVSPGMLRLPPPADANARVDGQEPASDARRDDGCGQRRV